jgi:5'-nucleotidase
LGIRVLFPADRPPDLVVSGINEGANAGAATIVSGTVGATIVAIRLLPKPVPAIAFSTKLMGEDALSATNEQHFQDVAAFGARLVTSLAETACGKRVLPYRIALNVNYPAKAPVNVPGIKLARQGTKSFADISFTEKQPGVYVPVFGPATGPDSPESDAAYLARGYITISVLNVLPPGIRVSSQRYSE